MLLALLGDAENLSKLQSLVGLAKMDCGQQSPTTAQSPDTPAKAKQEPKSGPSTQSESAPALSPPGPTLLWGASAPLRNDCGLEIPQ